VPSRRSAGALDPRLAPQVALSTVDHEALVREDELRGRDGRVKALRFSVGRDVPVSARDGAWTALADGSRLWVADVVSPGALGLRLHFADMSLPPGAELAVWGDGEAGTFTSGPLDKTAAEFHFGAGHERSDFWTGTVAGERAHVEYLDPAAAASGDELPFRLDRLQHVYRDPVADLAKDAAGPCHNDISCFPGWQAIGNAVSGIGTVGIDGLWCTGQLLNSKKSDFTPYWLTANHCLDNQVDASNAEFFWHYQTATCGGAAPSLLSVPRSVGATLLSTHPLSDYTLLLVEGTVPRTVYWAGWTSKKIKDGTPAVAIHHPSGDFKRISFGVKSPAGECATRYFPGRQTVHIDWTDAPTEPGSSGSGIFLASTGQLFGQLFGGPSSCSSESFDCYGTFATTFPRIKNYLNKGGSDDKSEQNDTCARARVVKPGVLGGRIVKVNDADWYRISVKPGQTVRLDLGFAHANGDIDLEVYGSCKTGPLALSNTSGNSETLAVTNVGNKAAFAYFRVFLFDDTRNSYDLSVAFQ
jgi:hypothetical protein